MSTAHIITKAIRSGSLSEIKLIFESPAETADQGPLELVIPLASNTCRACQNFSKIRLKRSFTLSAIPFPFKLGHYPASSEEWTDLTGNVYEWFQNVTHQQASDEWRWAVNFFWICYVASTPRFPATMNTEVNWDPAVVPLSGEFMSSHAVAMARDELIPWEKLHANLIANLVEWNGLKERWISGGVDVEEYRSRIIAHEF